MTPVTWVNELQYASSLFPQPWLKKEHLLGNRVRRMTTSRQLETPIFLACIKSWNRGEFMVLPCSFSDGSWVVFWLVELVEKSLLAKSMIGRTITNQKLLNELNIMNHLPWESEYKLEYHRIYIYSQYTFPPLQQKLSLIHWRQYCSIIIRSHKVLQTNTTILINTLLSSGHSRSWIFRTCSKK